MGVWAFLDGLRPKLKLLLYLLLNVPRIRSKAGNLMMQKLKSSAFNLLVLFALNIIYIQNTDQLLENYRPVIPPSCCNLNWGKLDFPWRRFLGHRLATGNPKYHRFSVNSPTYQLQRQRKITHGVHCHEAPKQNRHKHHKLSWIIVSDVDPMGQYSWSDDLLPHQKKCLLIFTSNLHLAQGYFNQLCLKIKAIRGPRLHNPWPITYGPSCINEENLVS